MLSVTKTFQSIVMKSIFFGLSMLLLTYYNQGDQRHYWDFYEALSSAKISDVMRLARSHVSSVEPLSAYLLWIGGISGVEKRVYISALNLFLLLGILLLMGKNKVVWYVQVLVLTNFYLLVLLTAAERLKIAYILLVYASIFSGRLGFFLAILSPFAHLQSLIFLSSVCVVKFYDNLGFLLNRAAVRKDTLALIAWFLPIAIIAFFVLGSGIISKARFYLVPVLSPGDLLVILVLAGAGVSVARNRLRLAVGLTALLIPTLFLGGDRMNMISFTLFFYLLMLDRRLHHPIILGLLGYLSLKSIFFIKNIFVYNNGFGGWLL